MKKIVSFLVLVAFLMSCIFPSSGYAQAARAVGLMPQPVDQVVLSAAYSPASLKGLSIDPNNPFKFDFIVHRGDALSTHDQKELEYSKLIKYFLAALAVPDADQWVNLSPYEKDRIIPDDFGLTEMGRDLLAQDYLLKQISASLTNPDTDLGRKFWDGVYAQAHQKFGTTDIPTDTFNKVWITPDRAVVYEKGNTVYVVESHLKVQLESDYLAARNADVETQNFASLHNDVSTTRELTKDMMRQIILPALEKEVNEGMNFAPLRQVYSGMLLATWYKRALKGSILARVYADQGKVKGVDQDPANNQKIYAQYVDAFQKGVFSMIREDVDRYSHELISRKYFSGGIRNGFGKDVQIEAIDEGRASRDFAQQRGSLDVVKAWMKDVVLSGLRRVLPFFSGVRPGRGMTPEPSVILDVARELYPQTVVQPRLPSVELRPLEFSLPPSWRNITVTAPGQYEALIPESEILILADALRDVQGSYVSLIKEALAVKIAEKALVSPLSVSIESIEAGTGGDKIKFSVHEPLYKNDLVRGNIRRLLEAFDFDSKLQVALRDAIRAAEEVRLEEDRIQTPLGVRHLLQRAFNARAGEFQLELSRYGQVPAGLPSVSMEVLEKIVRGDFAQSSQQRTSALKRALIASAALAGIAVEYASLSPRTWETLSSSMGIAELSLSRSMSTEALNEILHRGSFSENDGSYIYEGRVDELGNNEIDRDILRLLVKNGSLEALDRLKLLESSARADIYQPFVKPEIMAALKKAVVSGAGYSVLTGKHGRFTLAVDPAQKDNILLLLMDAHKLLRIPHYIGDNTPESVRHLSWDMFKEAVSRMNEQLRELTKEGSLETYTGKVLAVAKQRLEREILQLKVNVLLLNMTLERDPHVAYFSPLTMASIRIWDSRIGGLDPVSLKVVAEVEEDRISLEAEGDGARIEKFEIDAKRYPEIYQQVVRKIYDSAMSGKGLLDALGLEKDHDLTDRQAAAAAGQLVRVPAIIGANTQDSIRGLSWRQIQEAKESMDERFDELSQYLIDKERLSASARAVIDGAGDDEFIVIEGLSRQEREIVKLIINALLMDGRHKVITDAPGVVKKTWDATFSDATLQVVAEADDDGIALEVKDVHGETVVDKFFVDADEDPGLVKAIIDATSDAAQGGYGGVDLNSVHLDLQIKRDGRGVPLPVSQQDLEGIRMDGLVPVILDIRPASKVQLFKLPS